MSWLMERKRRHKSKIDYVKKRYFERQLLIPLYTFNTALSEGQKDFYIANEGLAQHFSTSIRAKAGPYRSVFETSF